MKQQINRLLKLGVKKGAIVKALETNYVMFDKLMKNGEWKNSHQLLFNEFKKELAK